MDWLFYSINKLSPISYPSIQIVMLYYMIMMMINVVYIVDRFKIMFAVSSRWNGWAVDGTSSRVRFSMRVSFAATVRQLSHVVN